VKIEVDYDLPVFLGGESPARLPSVTAGMGTHIALK